MPAMNCQDVRELFSSEYHTGVGLTEMALAGAHLTACSECARQGWKHRIESDSLQSFITLGEAGAAIKRFKIVAPLRACLANSVRSRADYVIHSVTILCRDVAESLVSLLVPLRGFRKRVMTDGAHIMHLAGYARLSRLRPRSFRWYAYTASNMINCTGVEFARIVRWLVLTASGWALYRGPVLQRLGALILAIRNVTGATHTSPRGQFEPAVGTIRLLRISSGILAVLIASTVVMWMPSERKAGPEADHLSSGARDPAALKQREPITAVERAEVPMSRQVPAPSQAGAGVGSLPETRQGTGPSAPVQADIPESVRTPAPVLGKASPAPRRPNGFHGATTTSEPLSTATRRHQTVDGEDVSDPSAVIDWLLSREHKRKE